MAVEFSYLQILNVFLQEYGVKIQQDVTRIDSLLRRACSEVKSHIGSGGGGGGVNLVIFPVGSRGL